MLVNLKKTEFAPAGVKAGSSSRTFHPESTGAKFNLKNYTGWNANSCIYNIYSHPQTDLFRSIRTFSVARQYLPVAGIETRLTQTPSQSF